MASTIIMDIINYIGSLKSYTHNYMHMVGGAVASWLVRSSPD